jgi:hypothetical protein
VVKQSPKAEAASALAHYSESCRGRVRLNANF